MSDLAAVREAEREARRAATEAREEWIRVRGRAGIVEYSDKRACGWVRDVVLQVYGREEWRDILAAVRECAMTPRTSPWAIRDKTYELAGRRRAMEHAERMIVDRQAAENDACTLKLTSRMSLEVRSKPPRILGRIP